MKKTVFLMSAAKKARIALAVMALCGMSFVVAQEAFAADPLPTTDLAVKTDANKNIICGDGAKAKDSGVKDTIIMGNGAVSMGHDSVVIGSEAKTDDINRNGVFMSSYNSVAIGAKAKAVANDSTAIGYGAVADYSFSTAIGSMAETAAFGLSLGANAKSTVYSDAIGVGAEAKKRYSVAIGFGSVADEENTVSVGSGGVVGTFGPAPKTRRIVNVADGINDHDAATVGQVKNMIAAGGSASFDGTKLNTDIQNVDVAGGYKDTATNPNVDTKGTIAGAINSAYQAGKEYTDTQLTDKVGIIAGGTYVEAGKNVAENIGKLDTQVKANADAIGIANTNITNVDNKIGSLSVDGTYIKKAKNVSENLVALDTQVKANADDIITANTKITTVDNKIGSLSADGKYIKKDNNVSANLVELDKQVNTNTTAIADKADKNLSNISAAGKDVIINLAGNKAGEVLDVKLGTISSTNYVSASGKVNENISALDKQVKTNADDIITANTKITNVDNKIGSLSVDGTYIKKAKNVSENLVELDTQVKNNVGAITAVDNKIGTIAGGTYVEAGKNVAENLGKLDTQVKANADDIITANTKITTVDNKIGSLSADGTYIKQAKNVSENLVELDKQVNTNTTAIADKADKNLSNISAAGKDVIINLAGSKAGDVVDGKLGTISSTNYVSVSGKVNENISALDKQVKTNADAIDLKANQELSNINATGENKIKTIAGVVVEGKLGTLTSSNYVDAANTVNANISALDVQVKDNADKITTVDNKIGSLSADGKYIKKAKNVSENLVELDKQVNTNTTAIADKADKNLSNISAAGKDVIINLAGNKAGEVLDVKLGAITSTHYVNAGNTVNANISALDTQLNKVENKVGTMTDGNYISAGNTVAGNLSALDNQLKANAEAINTKADKDLSNITDAGKNVIKDLAGNKAGEVVNTKLGDITSENYVKKDDTVNANISALDEQVKANADAINTKADKDLSNITDAGKDVIKDLASVKAGEVVDAKLGDITSNNYVNAGNTVNANISALDKQMKVNTDNIGDTGKLTTAGLGSNLSDAVVNVNNKVGTAEELKALKDAGLGDNLAQATAAVNKKADKNAEDIKTVNGRVDELGGRVDTLGGAVSKLDTKVNKVGAGAAALAALHPMDFDSDNKLTFAAGVGSYHGASAAAIGAFYRPSEQVMFSISGNMGNGENMVNAGVSFALDRPSKTPTTKAALVKTVVAQNEQIAALNETLAEQNEKIARLEAMVEKLAAKQNA